MLLDKLLRRKKKPKAPPIPRGDFVRIKPIRNPALRWEKNENGIITIYIPLRKPSKSKSLLMKFFLAGDLPKEKKIELDKVGSYVWDLCDGKRTIKNIIESLCKRYKMMPIEAEVSLRAYFTQLSKRGLIGFILPKDIRAKIEKFMKETGKKD